MKDKKVLIVSLIVLIIGVAGIFTYNKVIKDKAIEGTKEITVTVINNEENYSKEYKHTTEATSLGDVLVEMGIVEVQDGQFGRFLVGADNFTADESKQQWWKVIINGKDAETGIDSVMINNGDKINLELIVGW